MTDLATQLLQQSRAQITLPVGRMRRRRRGRGRARPQRHPTALTLQYAQALRQLVDGMQKATEQVLLEQLPTIIAQARAQRPDAGHIRVDDIDQQIEDAFSALRRVLGRLSNVEVLRPLVDRLAARVADWQMGELQVQAEAQLGVNIFVRQPWLADHLKAFSRDNVALIRSIPETLLPQMESIVQRGIRDGTRVEVLARDVRERFKVSQSRAKLIARDQVGKLHGELNELRQKSVGVTEYDWDTSRDERVRPGHAALRGTRQSWDKPPVVDPRTGRRAHPKRDFQCRCDAIPVFPDDA